MDRCDLLDVPRIPNIPKDARPHENVFMNSRFHCVIFSYSARTQTLAGNSVKKSCTNSDSLLYVDNVAYASFGQCEYRLVYMVGLLIVRLQHRRMVQTN